MIYTFGETILDIIFKGTEPLAARPGGAMLNSAVSMGRCGLPVSLISEISNDILGNWIKDFLTENDVATHNLKIYEQGKTPLAIASLNAEGEASYDFYKSYPEERLEHVWIEFEESDILLFGSFYSITPGIRDKVYPIIREAKNKGAIIVYDPNIRPNHAKQVKELLPLIAENMQIADVIRASEDDLKNIFGEGYDDFIDSFAFEKPGILITTDGSGAISLFAEKFAVNFLPEEIEPVSTIGAGDTFNAGLVYGLLKHQVCGKQSLKDLSASSWNSILVTASEFARDCCLSMDNYISTSFGIKHRSS